MSDVAEYNWMMSVLGSLHEDATGYKREALAIAIRRLTPAPPVEGSVTVRLAVGTDGDGRHYAFAACPYYEHDESDAMTEVRNNLGDGDIKTLAMATVVVPPVSIPEVTATVEGKS